MYNLKQQVDKPKISIIVPVFKTEEYLSECIESILNQTIQNIEIILVDDGSPDKCPAICDAYAKRDCRIKVIHKKNGGQTSARKAGVNVASGEYIGFVDSDDYIDSNMYESMLSQAEKYNADIVSTGYSKTIEDKLTNFFDVMEEGFYSDIDYRERILKHSLSEGEYFSFGILPNLVSKLFKHEIARKALSQIPEEIKIGEDACLCYNCLAISNSITIYKKSFYYYRTNINSISHLFNKEQWNGVRLLIKTLENLFYQHNVIQDMSGQLVKYYVYMVEKTAFRHLIYCNETLRARIKGIKSEIDKEMISNIRLVRKSINSKKKRVLLFCLRHRWILPIFLYYRGKRVI